jgi:hypothetical protein
MLALREPLPFTKTLPAVQLVGHGSHIAEPRFVRVVDEAGWRTLWAEHTGVKAHHGTFSRHRAPHIDFERFMVVGIFEGATTNTDGVVADAILTDRARVRIQFQHSTFQTSGEVDGGAQRTTPFGLFVIERSNLPVQFEVARLASKAGPISYERVHTIER